MIEGHQLWLGLVNAQDRWMTDESMLEVIPEEAREFEGAPDWPKAKALAYLNNNVNMLRLTHARLESGEALDLEMLNLALGGITLQVVDWRARPGFKERMNEAYRTGGRVHFLQPRIELGKWNRATLAIRQVVQGAIHHFTRYVDHRLGDRSYPGATPGSFRVRRCAAPSCAALVASPAGAPAYCSVTCTEETGRLR